MMPPDAPDPTSLPTAAPAPLTAPDAPPPVVQVPIEPRPHVLSFRLAVKVHRRHDLNSLEPDMLEHPTMFLAVGYDKRLFTAWTVDAAAGLLRLSSAEVGAQTTVLLSRVTHEELAALRFLSAVFDTPTTRRSHGWRAHLIEQLATMVPIVDFDGDAVLPAAAAGFFRSRMTLH